GGRGQAGRVIRGNRRRIRGPARAGPFLCDHRQRAESAQETAMPASTIDTHEVTNQPPPFAPRDLWQDDIALREAVARAGGTAFAPRLAAYGALAGGELAMRADEAHRDRPRLRTHDRFGH